MGRSCPHVWGGRVVLGALRMSPMRTACHDVCVPQRGIRSWKPRRSSLLRGDVLRPCSIQGHRRPSTLKCCSQVPKILASERSRPLQYYSIQAPCYVASANAEPRAQALDWNLRCGPCLANPNSQVHVWACATYFISYTWMSICV